MMLSQQLSAFSASANVLRIRSRLKAKIGHLGLVVYGKASEVVMPGLLRILILLIVIPFSVTAKSLNGFDLSNATVPLKLILSGGPPKDGIPALTDPKMLKGKEATYLKSDDVILGLVIAGEARAYPLRILNWHEIVNDKIAGGRYVVSYCPLCGSGMAFKAEPKSFSKRSLNFGVSGLLYSSDVLMYDSETESLWSQIHGEAVSGKLVGTSLEQIPMSLDLWGNWMARNPDTLVLSTDTGFRRDYSRDPYAATLRPPPFIFQWPIRHRKRITQKRWYWD
ncbi:hypothetical protein JCM19232_3477 [Vibrio ishigakensis]|uniref:DUF3179 domain-containing protein n=1 Tax=Vibrio ishigakensis TaxID=1481914 RepID=A0A0B8PCV5_9VIBR|nr:hypothetical protein JCM19232_3477 [Vibrio ishigakensis]